jgi:hypothetical protein
MVKIKIKIKIFFLDTTLTAQGHKVALPCTYRSEARIQLCEAADHGSRPLYFERYIVAHAGAGPRSYRFIYDN